MLSENQRWSDKRSSTYTTERTRVPVEGTVEGWRVEYVSRRGVLDVHARKENISGSSRVVDKFGVLCRIEILVLRHHRDDFDDLDMLAEVRIENEKLCEAQQGLNQ